MFDQITFKKDIPFTEDEKIDLNKSYVRLSSEEDAVEEAITQLQVSFKADKSKLESNLNELTNRRKNILESINKGYRTVDVACKSFIDEKLNKQYKISTEGDLEVLNVRDLPKHYQQEMSFSGFNVVDIDSNEKFKDLLEKYTDLYISGVIAVVAIEEVEEMFSVFSSYNDPVLARVSLNVETLRLIREYEESLIDESNLNNDENTIPKNVAATKTNKKIMFQDRLDKNGKMVLTKEEPFVVG